MKPKNGDVWLIKRKKKEKNTFVHLVINEGKNSIRLASDLESDPSGRFYSVAVQSWLQFRIDAGEATLMFNFLDLNDKILESLDD